MRSSPSVPWIVRKLVSVLAPAAIREEIEGDFVEGFRRVALERGLWAARRWAWGELLRLRPRKLRRVLRGWPPSSRGSISSRARQGSAGLGTDLSHALRVLRGRPVASVTIIGTVAVALTATTAVFSVVHSVLLSPLPYPVSDRLVRVWQTKGDWMESPNAQLRFFANRFPLSMPTYNDWASADLGFSELGASTGNRFVHQGPDGAEVVTGEQVTSGHFRTLGIDAQLGRTLRPEDDRVGAPRVVVVGYGLWQERFGGRLDVLGRSMNLDGEPHVIVGVMPSGFQSLEEGARLWAPLAEDAKTNDRQSQNLKVVGRLASGTDLAAADRRLSALQRDLAETYPEAQGDVGSRIEPLLESVVGEVRPTLWLLFAAVGLTLAVAIANIANILAVVGLARRRELAVKAALGAGGRRLARGLFVETALLSALGGLLGVILASLSMPLLLQFVPKGIPRFQEIGVDISVFLFGLGVTALTTVLVGVWPAMQAARSNPSDMMRRAGGRGVAGERSARRALSALVIAEVALAFVLLVAGGLLASSFTKLWSVDRGFSTENIAVLEAIPDPVAYPEAEDRDRFVTELRAELETIPGVEVSATNQVPLSGNMSTTAYQIERADRDPTDVNLVISVVLENYFDVMQIPLLAGRVFSPADAEGAPLVAVTSQRLAEMMWPGASPIGKRLRSGDNAEWTTIIGVVRDVQHSGLDAELDPKLYVPVWQNHRHTSRWVMRAKGDLGVVADGARAAVTRISPTTPVRNMMVLEDRIAQSVAVPRFRTLFVVGLSAISGLLALLGVYGVVSFTVTKRTQEIGVRMALGAQADHVMRQVLSGGLKLAGTGVFLGGLVALAVSRGVAEFLFDVEPWDPRTYLTIALLVGGVATLASYMPARRAAAVDPVRVLNSE